MMPQLNVPELILRKDVVKAVAEGKFHIYPVKTIDEGIELLTGIPAGMADEKGNYAENTVSYCVDKKLLTLAEGLKSFAEEGKPQPGRDETDNKNQGEGERSL